MTYALGELMSDEDSLAHYGVKGMKWGQRRSTPDSSGVSRADARSAIRKDNRSLARNLSDFESSTTRSNQIRSARANRQKVDRNYEDAKHQLKDAKRRGEIGKNSARVELNRLKNTRYETVYKSERQTAGEKIINDLVSALGSTQTSSLYR